MAKIFKTSIAIAILFSLLGMSAGHGLAATLPNFVGVNYGPFHNPGQNPGTFIPNSQFQSDLAIMSSKFTYIKTYGCDTTSNLSNFVPWVSQNYPKLKIFLGVFESSANRSTVTDPQLKLAIKQANTYSNVLQAVVVGNECLNTDSNPNPVSVAQLIADLQQVRKGIANKNILVITCLGYESAQTYGSQLMPYCDVMMVNIYPFYAGPYGIGIAQAWSNLSTNYGTFANQFNGKQLLVGETGWPSAGDPDGSAVPSVSNEHTFITDIRHNGPKMAPIFAFEAFDEPWKTNEPFNVGPHWGIWDQNGKPKF